MSEKDNKWQAQINSLKDGILKLYETKELYDVVFIKKGEEHHFKAHKLVLAARSCVFARMLMNTFVPDEIIIDEDSITATGFQILLRFIYINKMDTDDKQSIIEAYLAANYYQQRALQYECEKKIQTWKMTIDEVCRLLDIGLSITMLKDKCITFIKDNANMVIASPFFLEIRLKTLSLILHSGALKDVPVLQRIHKVMEWAGRHYRKETGEIDYSCVRRDFLRNKPPLLKMMEFEALKLEDLAVVNKSYKRLLTSEEVIQFMDYHADKNASNLPNWYTESTKNEPK